MADYNHHSVGAADISAKVGRFRWRKLIRNKPGVLLLPFEEWRELDKYIDTRGSILLIQSTFRCF